MARAQLYRELVERKANRVTACASPSINAWRTRPAATSSPVQQKIQRLMTYETKLAVDAEGNQVLKPYVMCDRVGNRGGMMRAAALMGGGAR